jgi:hypothetical protein
VRSQPFAAEAKIIALWMILRYEEFCLLGHNAV